MSNQVLENGLSRSPRQDIKSILPIVGTVALGVLSFFALDWFDSYNGLRKLLGEAGLDIRSIVSTVGRMKQQNLPPPTLPQRGEDLVALADLIRESLPKNTGGQNKPGRRVVPIVKKITDLVA